MSSPKEDMEKYGAFIPPGEPDLKIGILTRAGSKLRVEPARMRRHQHHSLAPTRPRDFVEMQAKITEGPGQESSYFKSSGPRLSPG